MPSAAAQDEARAWVKIVGTEIPNVFDLSEDSPYSKLYDHLTSGSPVPAALQMMPPRRTIHMLLNKSADCLFIAGASKQGYALAGMPLDQILMSNVANKTSLNLYTAAGSVVVTDLEQLRNKVVAMDVTGGNSGLTEKKLVESGVKVLIVQNLAQALAMLQQNRVQAVAVFDIDLMVWRQKHPEATKILGKAGLSLKTIDEVFLCWSNPTTVQFVSYVNDKIEELYGNGQLPLINEP